LVIEIETKSEFIAEKPLSTGTERILFMDDEKVLVRMGRRVPIRPILMGGSVGKPG